MLEGWSSSKLGKHIRIHSGVSPSQVVLDESGQLPFIKVEDLNNCSKYQAVSRSYTNDTAGSAPAGSVIFPKRGAAIMNNKIRIAAVDVAMDTNLMAVQPINGLDAEYLFYFVEREGLYKIADTSTIPQLNNKHINPYEIPLPPLPEQRKIAEMLRTWDQAIEKLSALRAAKQRTYASLLDDLIFGRRRLGGRSHDWHARRLGEVTSELTRRNASGGLGREVVMGVTKANGIVPMREQTIGDNLTRYKILPPRAFAYNPMRINVGSIAMSHLLGEALIRPDYILFECDDGRLSADYLDHLRRTHFWSHHINAGGSGSVRLRIYYDDLAAIRLPLPDFEEQQAIASVLDTARGEVRLSGKEIDALIRQKRGLMQKLLTGEWRVTVENAP